MMPSGITSQIKILYLFYVIFYLFFIFNVGIAIVIKVFLMNDFSLSLVNKNSLFLVILLCICIFILEYILRNIKGPSLKTSFTDKMKWFITLYIIRIAFYIIIILASNTLYIINGKLIMFAVGLITSLGVFLNKPGVKIILRDINLTLSEKKRLILLFR